MAAKRTLFLRRGKWVLSERTGPNTFRHTTVGYESKLPTQELAQAEARRVVRRKSYKENS